MQEFIEYRFGPILADILPRGRYIGRYIQNEISNILADIVTYLDNYFFYLRDCFILLYVHCGISMMLLVDVCIITYFF